MTIKQAFILFSFGILAITAALLLQVIFLLPTDILSQSLTHPFSARESFLVLFVMVTSEEIMRAILIMRYHNVYSVSSPLFAGMVFGAGFVSIELGSIAFNEALAPHFFAMSGIIILHIILSIFYFVSLQAQRPLWYLLSVILVGSSVHILYNTAIAFL